MDDTLANSPDQTGKKKPPYIPVLMAVGLAIYTLIARNLADSAIAFALSGNGWIGGYVLFFFSYPFIVILIFVGGLLWIGALAFCADSARRRDFLPIILWLASANCSYFLYEWIFPQEQTEVSVEESSETAAPSMTGVMIDSVNYLHDRGMKYTLYDISDGAKKPVSGSIVDPLGSGGAKECCFSLPRAWHAGIKLRVEWQDSDYERTHPEIYVKELELPRYDHPTDVYVVFYPQHDVEVVVSPAEPGHPEWAGRIKETPWDLCVAEHGRKVCKRAIPHAGFSLEELTGICTRFHERKEPDIDDLCQKVIWECVKNYEDEKMCAKLVWEPRKKEYGYLECLNEHDDNFCLSALKEDLEKCLRNSLDSSGCYMKFRGRPQ